MSSSVGFVELLLERFVLSFAGHKFFFKTGNLLDRQLHRFVHLNLELLDFLCHAMIIVLAELCVLLLERFVLAPQFWQLSEKNRINRERKL